MHLAVVARGRIISGQSSGSTFFVSSNQYTIQYRASDSAGNSADCYIYFMVIGIRCSTLSAPSHGSVGCTNTNFISSVCTISCDLGYHIVGSKIRTCTQSGNTGYWDGSTTTCSRTTCNTLSAPENGELSCTNGWYFGSSCTFSCNSGYSLNTSQPTLTCLQNGMWSSSGENMQCLDVQAPTFTGCPVSQTVTAAPLEISAVVTWNTPSSSDNSGESIPVIQEQGPLSGSALQEGDHMVMFTATDSSGNKATCTFTITVRVVYCPEISVDLPLQVNCSDGYVRGSECTFSCSTGYILDGQETSRCLLTGSDGAWDTATPTCQITQCEEPPLLENGGLKGECSRNFGSTCYFECNVGYEINNDVLTCLAQPDSSNVSWHGEVPECSRK
ncbi:E-selectin-like [Lytechinus variegatus]|uniref:E-selectin-like n=1 Tax=Lytechinus variegatus TaxID=7654 RepID=UPI001BB2B659|nr:E-selectin-like [Lytechinus variegatus]